jgi:cysteine desulfurase family protein (TIGR01976 family)
MTNISAGNFASMQYPVDAIRARFPALSRTHKGLPVAYLDGPGGSQIVRQAMDAMYAYMAGGGANLHGVFPTSIETEEMILDARRAVAQMFGAQPQEVAFGANMTTIAFALARALSREWREGDEIIVTELDHRANVDSWISAAQDKGVTVRWLTVDPESLTLNDELDRLLSSRTKLVAVGLASNAVGTINDVRTISRKAKQAGAIVAVDAVHAAPHLAIDRNELGADVLLCSAYKFFGPHIGIAVIREQLFEQIQPYKLRPAPEYLPDKLETGTQNHEGIAAIRPAIEFIAGLGIGESLAERIRSGFAAIEQHENRLAERIRASLAEIMGIRLYQAAPHVPKTPTIAFRAEGWEPREFCRRMCDDFGVFVADGDFYASTLAKKLGILESGGWIRAGLAPYNTEEEIDRFIEGVRRLMEHRG